MAWGSFLMGFMLGLVFNVFAVYLCRGLVVLALQRKETKQVEEFNKLIKEGEAAMEKMLLDKRSQRAATISRASVN